MSYKNAQEIIPAHLLSEIQKYCDGCLIYIPAKNTSKVAWGEKNGSKNRFLQRNREIREKYKSGATVEDLAAEYYLSTDSIRKIVIVKRYSCR